MSELPERLRERLDRVPGRVLLDYLGERLGAARTEEAVTRALAGEEAPPATRRIAEQLFVAMDATVGNWKVTLLASDGSLRKWSREETGAVDGLARFDAARAIPAE